MVYVLHTVIHTVMYVRSSLVRYLYHERGGMYHHRIAFKVIVDAYRTVPITEKVWTVLDPEFGDDAGKHALIVRALYGLKSADAEFRNHPA
jgi:hypothetical protein